MHSPGLPWLGWSSPVRAAAAEAKPRVPASGAMSRLDSGRLGIITARGSPHRLGWTDEGVKAPIKPGKETACMRVFALT
jgi:hypothetical protein